MMLQGGCNFRARRKLQLLNFLLGNSIDHTSTSLWCACARAASAISKKQNELLLLMLIFNLVICCCFYGEDFSSVVSRSIIKIKREIGTRRGEAAYSQRWARARRSLEMKLPLPVHGGRPDHARILIIFYENFCSTLGFILDALCSTSDFLKLDLFNVSSLSHGVNHDLLTISHSERSTAPTS